MISASDRCLHRSCKSMSASARALVTWGGRHVRRTWKGSTRAGVDDALCVFQTLKSMRLRRGML